MNNVVLVTSGTSGDLVPFIRIASAAKASGLEVVLISHCQYAAAASKLGISFDTWDTPEQYKRFVSDTSLLDSPAGFKEFADRHVFPYIEMECRTIEKHTKAGSIIVARHMSGLAASLVAEHRSLPLVSVLPAVAYANNFGLWIECCKHVLADRINSARRKYGLYEVRDWTKWAMMPNRFIGCWPSWFASRAPGWPDRTIVAGFFASDALEAGSLHSDLNAVLGPERKAVLITGGTAIWTHASRFYDVAIRACRVIGCRSVTVCPHPKLLEPSVQTETHYISELPFASVMPRVAAVIHHGGAGTMVRSMLAGTPQLVLPFGADRCDNANRIEGLGIGLQVRLPEWQTSHIAGKLDQIQKDHSIRQRCANIRQRLFDDGQTDSSIASLVFG